MEGSSSPCQATDQPFSYWNNVQKQRAFVVFCAVNALQLKQKLPPLPNRLDVDILVRIVKGKRKFAALDAILVSYLGEEADPANQAAYQPLFEEQLKVTLKHLGKKGSMVVVVPTLMTRPLISEGGTHFITDEEILNTEVLEHWQNHKYKYLVKVGYPDF